jgi:hypothetical protein
VKEAPPVAKHSRESIHEVVVPALVSKEKSYPLTERAHFSTNSVANDPLHKFKQRRRMLREKKQEL